MRFRRFLASCVPLALVALPTLSAACSQTANIDDVYMSLDSDGSRVRTIFFTDTVAIHCIAEGGFGRPNVDVEGYIHRYEKDDGTGNLVPDDEVVAYVDIHPEVGGVGAPPTKIDLGLTHADKNGQPTDNAPFPAGKFICEFRVDGKTQKTTPFEIIYAPCPPARITPLSVCTGFYLGGTNCPQGGLGTNTSTCSCDDVKGWVCAQ